jgi:hypothetical protein
VTVEPAAVETIGAISASDPPLVFSEAPPATLIVLFAGAPVKAKFMSPSRMSLSVRPPVEARKPPVLIWALAPIRTPPDDRIQMLPPLTPQVDMQPFRTPSIDAAPATRFTTMSLRLLK